MYSTIEATTQEIDAVAKWTFDSERQIAYKGIAEPEGLSPFGLRYLRQPFHLNHQEDSAADAHRELSLPKIPSFFIYKDLYKIPQLHLD